MKKSWGKKGMVKLDISGLLEISWWEYQPSSVQPTPHLSATFEEVKPKAMQMSFSFQVAFVCFSYSWDTMIRKLRGNTQIKVASPHNGNRHGFNPYRHSWRIHCPGDTGNSSKDTGRNWSSLKFRHPKTQLRIQSHDGDHDVARKAE